MEFYWVFLLEFFNGYIVVITAGLLLNAKDLMRIGSSALAFLKMLKKSDCGRGVTVGVYGSV